MAFVITNFIGFEQNNTQEASATSGTPTTGTSQVNSGTYGLELGDNGDEYHFKLDPFGLKSTPTYVYFGMYVKFTDPDPAADTSIIAISDGASGYAFFIGLDTTAHIYLRDQGAVKQATSSGTLSADTWYKLEVRGFSNATTGYVHVYIDGNSTPFVSMTSQDTSGTLDSIELRNNNTATSTFYVDDIYVKMDTADGTTADLLGVGDGVNWEIPGYYQPVTGGISQKNSPNTGSFANTGENPLNDSNAAEWSDDPEDADWAADGARAGPTTDITGTHLANKWWYRADRDGGGGTSHWLQSGKYDTTPTWTHTENLTDITTTIADYYIISASDGPTTTSESFAWGIRLSGARDLWIYEVGGFFLQTVSAGVTITAGVGQQTFTGVSASITPGAVSVAGNLGQQTFTGIQATITAQISGVTVNANVGQHTFTGVSASVIPGAVSVATGTGQQTFTGVSASVTPGAVTVTANVGQATFTGVSATVSNVVNVNANTGQQTFTGVSASITPGAISVSAGVGQQTFTGISATVTAGASIVSAGVGQHTFTGISATITPGAVTVTAAVGQVTHTGQSASITPGAVTVTGAVGQITHTSQAASVTPGAVSVTGAVGQNVFTGIAATISETSGQTVTAGVGQHTFTGVAGTILNVLIANVVLGDAEVYSLSITDEDITDASLSDAVVYVVSVSDSSP